MAEGGPSRKHADAPGATLEVEIVRHGKAWTGQVTDAALKRAAQAAFVAAPPLLPRTYQVTLVLTDDDEMRDLNRIWRGKDAPTNVLSFPSGEIEATGFLGDIVLAHETACKEAREQSIVLQDHMSHLVVHGVLHLLGFDHIDDGEAERMEQLERAALASLGVADPYAGQSVTCAAEVSP